MPGVSGPPEARGRRIAGHLRPGLPPMTTGSPESLGSQVALSTLGMVLAGAVRFGYTVLVGLAFGKVMVGQVNSGISLALFVCLLYPAAAAMAVTKFLARARGAGDLDQAQVVTAYLLRLTYLTGGGLAALTLLIAPGLLHVGFWDAVSVAALVMANCGYLFARSLLFGAGRVTRATLWDLAASALSLVLLVVVIVSDLSSLLLLPLTAGYAVYALANLPRRGSARPAAGLRAEMRSFVHISLVNSLATSGVLQLAMVAAQYFDPAQAGSFAAALALATPASLVSRSIGSVLFPSLAAARGRGDAHRARQQVDLVTRALIVAGTAVFGTLMIVSGLLIRLFFPRPGFDTAATVLPILLAAVLVQNVVVAASNMQLIRTQAAARGVMVGSLAGAVTAVVAWAVFAPAGGQLAVAWGFAASAVVASLLPVLGVWRLDHMSWTAPFLRFAVGLAVASLLTAWTVGQQSSAPVQVAVALAFVVGWLLLAWNDTRATVALVAHR